MSKIRLNKKTKTIVIALLVIVLILAALALFWHLLNQPANGTVINTQPKSLTEPQPSVRTLDSKYFTLQYSGRYQILNTDQATSASLQAWTLGAHQEAGVGPQRKISIIVTSLSQDGVTGDSAYKLFTAHPELYQVSKPTVKSDQVVIARRSDPSFQQTILWPHGSYLLTVTQTSEAENDIGNTEFQALIDSVQWR